MINEYYCRYSLSLILQDYWLYLLLLQLLRLGHIKNEPWHGISNNIVCVTSKASDQPAHTCSLIRAFASRLNIL